VVLTILLVVVVLGVSAFALHAVRRRRALELELELAELSTQVGVEGPSMLGNRPALTQALDIEISRCGRTGRAASLLVICLDSALWHGQADSCAQEALAEVIRTRVRGEDVGYQLGRDEFAMILPETRGQGALVAATRIEAAFLASGGRVGSLTVGIAELGPGIDSHQLFRHAYCAMLAANRDGRSRLLLYSPEFEHASSGNGLEDRADFEAVDGPAG
jgi:diguanylate cyclase (GGDEF)-like protein